MNRQKRIVIVLVLLMLISIVAVEAGFFDDRDSSTTIQGSPTPVGARNVLAQRQAQSQEPNNAFASAFGILGNLASIFLIPKLFQGAFWFLFFILIMSAVKAALLRVEIFKSRSGEGKLSPAGNGVAFSFAGIVTISLIKNTGFAGGSLQSSATFLSSTISGWTLVIIYLIVIFLVAGFGKGETAGVKKNQLFAWVVALVLAGFFLQYVTEFTNSWVIEFFQMAIVVSIVRLVFLIGGNLAVLPGVRDTRLGQWAQSHRENPFFGNARAEPFEGGSELENYSQAMADLAKAGKGEINDINKIEDLQQKKVDFYNNMDTYWNSSKKGYKVVDSFLRGRGIFLRGKHLPDILRDQIRLATNLNLEANDATTDITRLNALHSRLQGTNTTVDPGFNDHLQRMYAINRDSLLTLSDHLKNLFDNERRKLPTSSTTWTFMRSFKTDVEPIVVDQNNTVAQIKIQLRKIVDDYTWASRQTQAAATDPAMMHPNRAYVNMIYENNIIRGIEAFNSGIYDVAFDLFDTAEGSAAAIAPLPPFGGRPAKGAATGFSAPVITGPTNTEIQLDRRLGGFRASITELIGYSDKLRDRAISGIISSAAGVREDPIQFARTRSEMISFT